ncbi:hypothetical protein DSO57_1033344 [Entomophthora muscae]|uniref:Uncharacterized protein n=2 Tax=Entomophthora muscae TaxID=34485 RepID=A0ACC2S278_9FUNG|nr:hypothetical protein DSO57_1033344 [Entomophthora muscae]
MFKMISVNKSLLKLLEPRFPPSFKASSKASYHQNYIHLASSSSKDAKVTDFSVKKLGHIPVLRDEILEVLDIQDNQIFIDATFGYGGYTKAILDSNPTCKVVAIDQDPYAYLRAHEMSQHPSYQGRLVPLLGKFGDVTTLLEKFKSRVKQHGSVYFPNGQWIPDQFDGLMMDVGLSSGQLDDPARGFSFMRDGRLDMRMCQVDLHTPPEELEALPEADWELQRELYAFKNISAYDVVNYYDVHHLSDIIHKFGEERFAKRIAQAIVEARDIAPIESTAELSNIISKISPRHQRPNSPYGKFFIHPATRTFQGLRIYVNKELDELSNLLAASPHLVKPGGTLAAVTFHSLEDRLVKRFLVHGPDALAELSISNRKKNTNNTQMKAIRRRRHHEKMDSLTTEIDSTGEGASPQYLDLGYSKHAMEASIPTDALAINATTSYSEEEATLDEYLPFLLPKPRSEGLIIASDEELELNPRARSAKLRWAIRA